MSKEKLQGFAIISALLAFLGIILIAFSVKFGTSYADSWLASRGGADTAYYYLIVKSYINNFLVSGSILLGLGLVSSVFFYFKMVNFEG
ncbi:hypothetical protein [Mesobacillus selenatarsenatis]|uniref:Uncharacterized protein n=1 Tax=Mesobacillus selenatarsenatis (strain DSM 18680 / JCM 14380 / FERM P-15431 / SF-1) TaxID=1321606 RepID=A0A0A8X2U8_MESS1|nr:hypothetical protein [Mesobacillus selenatarsenatis]GAM12421.1 hypothetical protein SAMD00020551_0555 [Mesobacillus selenatarsenatis SF-1]